MNNNEIKKVSEQISNCMYNGNLQATKELMELFDNIVGGMYNMCNKGDKVNEIYCIRCR